MGPWIALIVGIVLVPSLVRRALLYRARRSRLDYRRSRDPVSRLLAEDHRRGLDDDEQARLRDALDHGRRFSPMRRDGAEPASRT